ncbi:Conjugal transfer protein TrbC (plasmid) [Thioalkalivibrio sp. K90mix]|uniref:TrbC/VirB2 family protein n=1 Tax=Thioalkalivibrio sp. (strain K90mix) TaxID=396595 RepID=UPI000195A7AF|nr:TrbC/VirB2 family protein [Thioalkalivibrio sp. K90mix]ADC73304.1 Conjugal transfer protein TrbC [Thioalkalivibrio sp. K90mix]
MVTQEALERAGRVFVACLPAILVLVGLWPESLMAQDGGRGISDDRVPWIETLTQIRDSFCGPVAHYTVVIAIVVTGLTMAFGEIQGMALTLMRVVMGSSIALMAVKFIGAFGFGDAECTARM